MPEGMDSAFDGPESERWIEPLCELLVEQAVLTSDQAKRARVLLATLDRRLGWLAMADGYMSARDVCAALSFAHEHSTLFGDAAVEMGLLTPRQLTALLSLQASPFHLLVKVLVLSELADHAEVERCVRELAELHSLAMPGTAVTAGAPREPHTFRWREGHLLRAIDRLQIVATLPHIQAKVVAMLDNPEPSAAALAELITDDPALSIKLLRVVGASAGSTPAPQTPVAAGIAALGPGAVRQLVLASAVLESLPERVLPLADAIWEHSVRAAEWASVLASRWQVDGDARLCALLHELGAIVMLQAVPDAWSRIEVLAQGDATLEQIERQILGTTHADVGAHVSQVWGLPPQVHDAALYHGTPTVILSRTWGLTSTTRVTHAACRLARAFPEATGDARERRVPVSVLADRAELDGAFLAYHALDAAWLREIAPEIEARTLARLARLRAT
jgi:HD-like signal output (HDOD) protein